MKIRLTLLALGLLSQVVSAEPGKPGPQQQPQQYPPQQPFGPQLPASAMPAYNAGQPIYAQKCSECHGDNPAATKDNYVFYGTNSKTLKFFQGEPQPPADAGPGVMPLTMWQHLNQLSDLELDELSVYLAGADNHKNGYTVKGKAFITGHPDQPIADATITMTSSFLTSQPTWFPAVTTQTDAQGNYTLSYWAGRKTLTVSKKDWNFTPNHLDGIDLNFNVYTYGNVTQNGMPVTGSMGPTGPLLSGLNFHGLSARMQSIFK